MSEIPRKDFLLFQRQYEHEQEHYVSGFEDDAKLAAMRHLFPEKGLTPLVEALRGFELFIIRLGRDAESVLLGTNEHVTTFRKIDSGYFSSTNFPSREEAEGWGLHRSRDGAKKSLTGVGALKPPRARTRLLLWMQETRRG